MLVNVLVVGVVLVALKNIGGYISTGGTKSICVSINKGGSKIIDNKNSTGGNKI